MADDKPVDIEPAPEVCPNCLADWTHFEGGFGLAGGGYGLYMYCGKCFTIISKVREHERS